MLSNPSQYFYKENIKGAGYYWAKKKCMWYFRPSDYKSHNKKSWKMDDIRTKYGSEKVKGSTNHRAAIAH